MIRRFIVGFLSALCVFALVVPAVAVAQPVDEQDAPNETETLVDADDAPTDEAPADSVALDVEAPAVEDGPASCGSDVTTLDRSQCEALIAVGRATDGSRLFPGRGWSSEDDPSDPCTWRGVTCRNDVVMRLEIPKAQLQGELSPAIGDLVDLRVLELSNVNRANGITSIPATIGALTNLQTLRLTRHQLVDIPAEIDSLTSLVELDLKRNNVRSLPEELGNLSTLTDLDVSQNDLTSLPVALGSLPALTDLNVAVNPLAGLPSLAGAVALEDLNLSHTVVRRLPDLPPSMREIDADGANLIELPENVGDFAALEVLDVGDNRLSQVPVSIGNLAALRRLDVGGNRIAELPAELGNLAALAFLDIDRNQLRGNQDLWAAGLVANANLTQAWLRATVDPSNDCMTTSDAGVQAAFDAFDAGWDQCDDPSEPPVDPGGDCPVEQDSIPTSECAAAYEMILRLWGDWEPDEDPCDWSAITCADGHVVGFSLRSTRRVNPVLPADVNNLPRLRSLTLERLKMQGIPAELANNTALETLWLRGNLLETLPIELAEMPNLTTVFLSSNPLDGIPDAVLQNPNIRSLSIAQAGPEDIGGLRTIPAEIGNMANLRTLDLSSNSLESLPTEFANLRRLTKLDLAYNDFAELPAVVGELDALRELRLRRNGLTSIAPIQTLTNLRTLHASDNELTVLPPLDRLDLNEIWLDQNQLTAEGIASLATQPSLVTVWLPFNELRGDITDVARQLVRAESVRIADGLLANDCVTVTDADLAAQMTELSPSWDRCDVPDGNNPLQSCEADVTDLDGSQCEALLVMGRTPEGVPIFPGKGWSIDNDPSDPCGWTGVTCAGSTVVGLNVFRRDGFPSLPLDITAIDSLADLTSLSITVGNITEVPASIGGLNKLERLTLRLHDFAALPPEIGSLTALKTVDLAQNKLTTVPVELFQLPLVEELSLWANPLRDGLPAMDGALELRTLDVGGSALRRLPNELPPNLEQLLAVKADLVELPDTIGTSAPLLEEAELLGNKLSDLPDSFGSLPLRTLNLSQNRFEQIPSVVGQLSLVDFDVSVNQLRGNQDAWAIGLVDKGSLASLDLYVASVRHHIPEETNACMTTTSPVVQITFDELDGDWDRCDDESPDIPPPFLDPGAVCPAPYDGQTRLPAVECAAVVEIYTTVYGDSWRPRTNRICGADIMCEGDRVVGLRVHRGPEGIPLPAAIAKLTAMQTLSVQNGDTPSLPDEINQLTELRTLSLNNGGLNALPTDLSGLTKLEVLDAEGNNLTEVPASVIAIPNLRALVLNFNPLEELPANFGEITATEIYLRGTRLEALPDSIGQITAATVNLAGNRLTAVPASIASATIFNLDLSNNELTDLPEGITVGVRHQLDVEGNSLTSLPGSIGSARWFELDAARNQLTELPASMGDMAFLRRLDLENNALIDVTPIGSIAALVEVQLGFNELNELPELATLQLESFIVNQNRLRALPAGLTSTSLERLDASYNRITELPSDIGNLRALFDLNLRTNQLTQLPDSFGSLQTNEVNLRSNRLTSLPETIGNLTVRTFNLRNNRLTSLPENFGDIKELTELQLRENNLSELPASFGEILARVNQSFKRYTLVTVNDNQLRGDITPWVARAAALGYEGGGGRLEGEFKLEDGEGGNDCLTLTDASLAAVLARLNPEWDRCDIAP